MFKDAVSAMLGIVLLLGVLVGAVILALPLLEGVFAPAGRAILPPVILPGGEGNEKDVRVEVTRMALAGQEIPPDEVRFLGGDEQLLRNLLLTKKQEFEVADRSILALELSGVGTAQQIVDFGLLGESEAVCRAVYAVRHKAGVNDPDFWSTLEISTTWSVVTATASAGNVVISKTAEVANVSFLADVCTTSIEKLEPPAWFQPEILEEDAEAEWPMNFSYEVLIKIPSAFSQIGAPAFGQEFDWDSIARAAEALGRADALGWENTGGLYHGVADEMAPGGSYYEWVFNDVVGPFVVAAGYETVNLTIKGEGPGVPRRCDGRAFE